MRFRAHIANRSAALRERGEIRGRDVVHADEIARLPAVAENRERFSLGEKFRKNINDAAFTVCALARAVDIAVAKDGVIETVEIFVQLQIFFRHHFRETVERGRRGRFRFRKRERRIIAVHGGRGGENDFFYARFARRFEDGEESHDVFVGVEMRIVDGNGHHRLRRFVVHGVEPMRFENFLDILFLPNVDFDEFGGRMDKFRRAGGQVIQNRDAVPVFDEEIDDVRSDETGAARDTNIHMVSFRG